MARESFDRLVGQGIELQVAIGQDVLVVHQVCHIVALESSLFFTILCIVLSYDEPLQHVKVTFANQQCFMHLLRVLHQILLLTIARITKENTTAIVVRLKSTLPIAKSV